MSPTPERNKYWDKTYPTVVFDFSDYEKHPLGKSVYGNPNPETLALFDTLRPGARVFDVGAGDGRYTVPLLQKGLSVIPMDVDADHLHRLAENVAFAHARGSIPNSVGVQPVIADAGEYFPLPDRSVDAALDTGFGYLKPPSELNEHFAKMVRVVKPDGLIVFEVATDRVRTDLKGNDKIGPEEYRYSFDEGLKVVTEIYRQNGVTLTNIAFKEIDLKPPEASYILNNKLLITSGRVR